MTQTDICIQCGHMEEMHDADTETCLSGYTQVTNREWYHLMWTPGPDACGCVRFDGPQL